MTTHSRAHRRRLAISVMGAGALLAVLALATACGSSSSDEAASPGDRDQPIAYAKCMRDNGVADFPDPDSEGRFRGLGHEQQDNAQFRTAQETCRDLAPGGLHENLGDPAFVGQMRQFSQCMRENGLPDFPDPDTQGRLRGTGHEQQDTPQYRTALEACRDMLPGGGGHQ